MNPILENMISRVPVRNKKKSKLYFFIIFIFFLVIVFILFFYNETRVLEKNSLNINDKNTVDIVDKVKKLIDLPNSEMPTLIKVVDLKPLEGNDFFKNATIGNFILFYPNSGKIYLYDQKNNIVLNVANINEE